ncbi:hypothetical protein ACGF07_03780 [Kitasatospora sp. NPDC048194]|uniref:hypothetical protein n=1 Tax=Kitasatospora sp. NPDC048194 TaxID=3364045 RepID=UPI003724B412
MTSRSKAVRAIGIALAGLSVLCGATTAAAAPAKPASAQRFEAQARAAGLTAGQASSLQEKVDSYLATVGGTQVAPNRIQLAGATVYVAVPGEDHPRDLTGTAGAVSYDPCAGGGADYKHMCAYRGTWYTGDEVDMYNCARYYFSTWSGPGSWDNNQTTGTVARMYGASGAWVFSTKPAHSSDPNGNWTPVHSIVNC